MDATLFQLLLEKLGLAAILLLAVRYQARQLEKREEKLVKQYENRIGALEKASDRCEEDRMKLRDEIIQGNNTSHQEIITLVKDLADLKKRLMRG